MLVDELDKEDLNIMDTRLLIVFLPLGAAASWALYNIGRVAIQQVSRFLAG